MNNVFIRIPPWRETAILHLFGRRSSVLVNSWAPILGRLRGGGVCFQPFMDRGGTCGDGGWMNLDEKVCRNAIVLLILDDIE